MMVYLRGFIDMVCDKKLPNIYVLHWVRENIDIVIGRANGTTFMEINDPDVILS